MVTSLVFHRNANNSEAKEKTGQIAISASLVEANTLIKTTRTTSSMTTMTTSIMKQGRKSASKQKCIKWQKSGAVTETDVDEYDCEGKRKEESSSKKKRCKKCHHCPLCSNCTAECIALEETYWKEESVCVTEKENVDVGTKKSKKLNYVNHAPLDHHCGDGAVGDMSVLEDDEHGTTTTSSLKQQQLINYYR
eukprot:8183337-Ditylum_brightwellii.AAC.1